MGGSFYAFIGEITESFGGGRLRMTSSKGPEPISLQFIIIQLDLVILLFEDKGKVLDVL